MLSTEKNTQYDFSAICLRIMECKGLQLERDVAKWLDMKPGAFSERKKRNSFPLDRLRVRCQEESINYDWVLTGEGHKANSSAMPKWENVPPELADLKTKVMFEEFMRLRANCCTEEDINRLLRKITTIGEELGKEKPPGGG